MQKSFSPKQNEEWEFVNDGYNETNGIADNVLGCRAGLVFPDRMQWSKSGFYVQVIQHIAAEVDPIGSGITYDEFEAMIVSLPDFASSFSLVF